MANPFRAGLKHTSSVHPCAIVIFGVTGDLANRKLIPALYNLGVDGLLPAHFSLLGFARRGQDDAAFRKLMEESVKKHSRRKPLDEAVWKEFSDHSFYIAGEFGDASKYVELKNKLEEIDRRAGVPCHRVFYFAVAADAFAVITQHLREIGLLAPTAENRTRARVIVEKPFGHDLDSARVLNRTLLDCMAEEQIYRIDHYLGKETVQNLMVFRFANGIFEPIWNHKYIEHVEISVAEALGVESRAGYFDKAGILRDIVQNHAFQLLCLVALEPPVEFAANAVRDEKVKVLRSIRPFARADVSKKVVRARYQSGSIAGQPVTGYLGEPGVDPKSTTETFVALELALDNWRWAGVPFYLRAGKRLPKRVTEISIHFRNVPYRLFQNEDVRQILPNILSFQIQPDEGIGLKVSAKPPGPQVRVQTVNMEFSYGTSFGTEPPEAYERLLLDCMRGDATLFTRSDEIEHAWSILRPIQESWAEKGPMAPPILGYEAGSWGPQAADELLMKQIGKPWRRL